MAINTYEMEQLAWRASLDDRLRADDGWLTLVGLHWLQEGDNTLGGDLPLPDSAPPNPGVITFSDGSTVLTTNVPVLVDGVETQSAVLRDDSSEQGPSLIQFGTISFYVIKRSDQYGIRVRDTANPARQSFTGRQWFPLDSGYIVTARFIPHPEARTMNILNSTGQIVPMDNPGVVEFELRGQQFRLEAFDGGEFGLWFLFKDATNGQSTYGSGRFMYAPHPQNGVTTLDFNRAYSPPCAFTPYATCPLAPRENTLKVAVEAGEKYISIYS